MKFISKYEKMAPSRTPIKSAVGFAVKESRVVASRAKQRLQKEQPAVVGGLTAVGVFLLTRLMGRLFAKQVSISRLF